MTRTVSFSFKCLFTFLTLLILSCTHEQQTISGRVLDESGMGISGVSVKACYSDWGWSSGQLVWDKTYCSEPAKTDTKGHYLISFNGPDYLRLRASKEGWIQNQDFNSDSPEITLVNLIDQGKRNIAEQRQRERNFRQRLPNESDFKYYNRVIIPRSQPITLNYHSEKLSIIPTLLEAIPREEALFAVRGTKAAANAFINEILLSQDDGQEFSGNSSFRLSEPYPEQNIHFVHFTLPEPAIKNLSVVGLLIPSVKAMFDLKKWQEPDQRITE